MRVAEKWDGRMPGVGTAAGDWRERARRAEAERDAARLDDRARRAGDARPGSRELERALDETTDEHLLARHRAAAPACARSRTGGRA